MGIVIDRAWRFATVVVVAVSLAACGGSSANPFGGSGNCFSDTQTQLISPFGGQTGVAPNIGSIAIVANGMNNSLYTTVQNSPGVAQLLLTDTFGGRFPSGSLSLFADPGANHPYQMDFYYQASVQSLAVGRQYSVYLNDANSGCQPSFIGGFST
ncbi:MAG: hypothetical protein ACREM8_04390 [Vulcanimicrobiaceae bacterium]